MNIQADISWIKSELNNVTEPHLIEAIKQMLAYRKKKSNLTTSFFSTTTDELKLRAEAALKSIEKGEIRTITDFKKEIENWKTRQAI